MLKPGANADGGKKAMYSIKDGCTSSILLSRTFGGSFTSSSDLVTGDNVSDETLVELVGAGSQFGDLVVSSLLTRTRVCPPKMASSSRQLSSSTLLSREFEVG